MGAGLAAWREARTNPQTDDAEVLANLIGIAPEVNGRIVKIPVKDNQFVHKAICFLKSIRLPMNTHSKSPSRSKRRWRGRLRDLERTIGAQTSAVVAA